MKVVINGPTALTEVPGILAIANDAELVCAPDRNHLREALPEADVLLGWNFQSKDMEGLWHKADNLKWIHWCGAGVDDVLSPELAASDIVLTNARGVFDLVMAEYVLGYMLSEVKQFRKSWQLQADKQWQNRVIGKLSGTSAVIFGVGSIGRTTARLLRSVGVTVAGVGRTERSGDADFGEIYASDQEIPILKDADWVIGLLPMTSNTARYYNSKFFDGMKAGARFINLGRGESLDETALIAALKQQKISGAMLDVFNDEPLEPDRPIWSAPNIAISAHISGYFAEYEADMAQLFLENFARFTSDEQLLNVVDKSLGFVPSEK